MVRKLTVWPGFIEQLAFWRLRRLAAKFSFKRVAQATIADVQDNGRRKIALDQLVAEFDGFEFGI